MKVISFVTQKGGSGKSTLAASCAVVAGETGKNVFVLEMDKQATLSQWYEARQAETPQVDIVAPDKLEQAIKALEKTGYDLVIIDTPGVDNPGTNAAIRIANLCIIPVRPTAADVRACQPTVAAITRLDCPFTFVLNQTPPRGYRIRETAEGLNMLGVLSNTNIVMRNDHQDAIGAGYGVTEFEPDGKAAEEIRQLWTYIEKKLGAKNNVKAA